MGGDLEGPPPLTAGPLVGRQREVEALEGWFQRAAQRHRQLVFVSGEAGVGKTTVVELFLARLAAGSGGASGAGAVRRALWGGGTVPALLGGVGAAGPGARRDEVLAVLRRYAPLWLVQLPGLVSEPELERLQRRLHGATPAACCANSPRRSRC